MANAVYPKYKEAAISGGSNTSLAGTVKAVVVDSADYTYSATHEFLSSVPSGARVATSSALANKTYTSGVFDSDDPTLTGVTGDQSEAIILYIDTGSDATSRLVAFIDTGITGMPYTPSGADLTLKVNASGWFAL